MPWRWCLWLSFAAAMRIVQEDAFPSNCTLHAAVSRIIANKQLRQLQAAPFCQVWPKTHSLQWSWGYLTGEKHECFWPEIINQPSLDLLVDGIFQTSPNHSPFFFIFKDVSFSLFFCGMGPILHPILGNRGTAGTLHLAGRYKVASLVRFPFFRKKFDWDDTADGAFLMGKSTISTGPFSSSQTVFISLPEVKCNYCPIKYSLLSPWIFQRLVYQRVFRNMTSY